MFDLLSRFCHSSSVGCANLMTCIGSLTLIARFRVSFIGKVLIALETLTSKKHIIKKINQTLIYYSNIQF